MTTTGKPDEPADDAARDPACWLCWALTYCYYRARRLRQCPACRVPAALAPQVVARRRSHRRRVAHGKGNLGPAGLVRGPRPAERAR